MNAFLRLKLNKKIIVAFPFCRHAEGGTLERSRVLYVVQKTRKIFLLNERDDPHKSHDADEDYTRGSKEEISATAREN